MIIKIWYKSEFQFYFRVCFHVTERFFIKNEMSSLTILKKAQKQTLSSNATSQRTYFLVKINSQLLFAKYAATFTLKLVFLSIFTVSIFM